MTTARAADTAHREIVLEDHLVEQLVACQGYCQRQPDDFGRTSGLDKALVLEFVQGTQANEWVAFLTGAPIFTSVPFSTLPSAFSKASRLLVSVPGRRVSALSRASCSVGSRRRMAFSIFNFSIRSGVAWKLRRKGRSTLISR
jgi:hypothetical protein